jgi:hypothetical protein
MAGNSSWHDLDALPLWNVAAPAVHEATVDLWAGMASAGSIARVAAARGDYLAAADAFADLPALMADWNAANQDYIADMIAALRGGHLSGTI